MIEPLSQLAELDHAWLVGGAVRDRLLGRESTDYDVAVAGDPSMIARSLGRAKTLGQLLLAAIDRSTPVREEQRRLMTEAKAKLALAVHDGQTAGSVRRDVEPEAIAELLLAIVGGIEVRLAYGTFDVTSVTALLRMLRPATP